MNLQEFKNEFRLICSDTWGDSMESFFECAGQMNKRGMDIPIEWQYSPGMGSDGTCEDSYWYELFEETDSNDLIIISNFLHRYTQYLDYKGMSY